MLETSRKWGMLALALATGAALAVGPAIARPPRAYADDGIEVASEGEDAVDLEGATPLEEARVDGEFHDVELGDGAYVLDGDQPASFRTIEVMGDATLVLGGRIVLTEGGLHVAEGAHLRVVARDGCDAGIAMADGIAANPVYNQGTVEMEGVELEGGRDCTVRNCGTLTMRGCRVSGASCPGIDNERELTLDGCTIEGNKAHGVYNTGTGSLHLVGATVIDGNEGANLLIDGLLIDADGLADDARIGVTIGAEATKVFLRVPAAEAGKVACFFGDTRGTQVVVAEKSGGYAYFRVAGKPVAYVDTVDGGKTKYRYIDDFKCDLGTCQGECVTLDSGWYYVSQDNSIEQRIDVAGDATIVLFPGATLTCLQGIHVPQTSTLTIYSQEGSEGKLVAKANNMSNVAGIGGNEDESNGVIAICGGSVEAWGGKNGAGIGGGNDGHGKSVQIYGGTVKAYGGEDGAGIGGGCDGHGGRTTIFNGVIEAVGREYGAGIGGGRSGEGGTITIRGGKVDAWGGQYASMSGHVEGGGAGIGGGDSAAGGSISILGGEVSCPGNTVAAGIGGGCKGAAGSITIKNAVVSASAENGLGAAIGSGYDSDGESFGEITIEGSTVDAKAYKGAAIGSGYKSTAATINIRNSKVIAESCGGAGIGGGLGGKGGVVSISGESTVDAASTADSWKMGPGAAIGRGGDGFRIDGDSQSDIVGEVHLSDNLKVTDLSLNVDMVATFGEREGYCLYRNHVKVEPGESRA